MAISTSMIEEMQFCGSVDEATSLPGAYVIAIELAETVTVTLRGRSSIDLPTGRYLYCALLKGWRIEAASFTTLPTRQVYSQAYRSTDRARQRNWLLDFVWWR